MNDVTQILNQLDAGNPLAHQALFEAVYRELREMAAAQLAREKPGQTLQPTALVHEAWLRLHGVAPDHNPSPPTPLPGGERGDGPDAQRRERGASEASYSPGERRRYFFAAAAEAMRRILIEQARRKQAEKRGGARERIDLDSGLVAVHAPEQFDDLHEALEALGKHDARKAELVRLRYFLGLSLPEIAEILAISQATAERDWAFARAWLYTQLHSFEENQTPDEGVH